MTNVTFNTEINEDCVETQVPNPDYIPATDGFWKTEPNPEYVPATDGYYTTVPNPDYVPAIPEHTLPGGFMKWNWTGGPTDTVPSFPGSGWHQVGITNDSKSSTPGVVHQGNGKASYFYYEPVETVIPEIPAIGSEFIDIWTEGTPAVGEETIQVWYDGTPAVGDEFLIEHCPVVQEPVVTTFSPVVSEDCGDVFWSHPAFKGGFGEPNAYLVSVNGGDLVPYTPGDAILVSSEGSEWSVTLKAKYEGLTFEHQLGQHKGVGTVCVIEDPVEDDPVDEEPVDEEPVDEEPVDEEEVVVPTDTPEEIVETKTDTVEDVVVSSTNTPQELATTGSVDPFTGGLLGLVLLAAGGTLMIKNKLKKAAI